MPQVKYVISDRTYEDREESTPAFYGAIKDFIEYAGPECIVSGPYDTGKGLPLDSSVMTPSGPVRIGKISVGDVVLAGDGSPTVVTGVYPQGIKQLYEITLSDDTVIHADGEHLWQIHSTAGGQEVVSTKELSERNVRRKAGNSGYYFRPYWLPTAGPAQFSKNELPIDPYVMGILLSEGCFTGSSVVSFSTGDQEVVDMVRERAADATIVQSKSRPNDYRLTRADGESYYHRIKSLGLWGVLSEAKFIPGIYSLSDIDDRIDLLRGLMDGDGTIDKRYGSISYSSTSKFLIKDLQFLVESLGGYVSSIGSRKTRYTHNGKKLTGAVSYRATIILPTDIDPFYLERKSKYLKKETEPRRFIHSVEYDFDDETVCIAVDHPSQLFLTDHFIVTHNTFGMMHKVHRLAWTYPGAQILLIRKSYAALVKSALVTLVNKVLPVYPDHPDSKVSLYGGGVPKWLDYEPVGKFRSRIWLGGMDDPEKVLSSEYDFIAVPQAEELTLHDWEQLLGRCSGRAGNAPWHQIMGDCNPGPPNHWIMRRETLKVFYAEHTHNPTMFMRDNKGELVKNAHGNPTPTKGGESRIKILQSLTGLRYKRGYLGLWVGAEGQVYEDFDPSVHEVDWEDLPGWKNGVPPYGWKLYRAIDFGYTHPFVCQWWAEDEDGRLYLYREIYMTRRTVKEHVEGVNGNPGILDYSDGEKYEATICDWDAGDRATLEGYGIQTVKADKQIDVGIQAVQERLKIQGDGRPRIFFVKNALVEVDETLRDNYQPIQTTDEFSNYVWRDMSRQREATARDEVPIRTADHGMDSMRYEVKHVDNLAVGYVNVVRYA